MWRPFLRGEVAQATKGKAPPLSRAPRGHGPFFRTTAEKGRLQAQERDRTHVKAYGQDNGPGRVKIYYVISEAARSEKKLTATSQEQSPSVFSGKLSGS